MSTAHLLLEDGTLFQGDAIGATGAAVGEVVFNTAMSGYQEILTDPSYKGQIVVMTYPHIGNYGVNPEDIESPRPWVEGFVVRELSPVMSNFRATQPLDAYLTQHGIVGIQGINTRALTERLRVTGAMRGILSTQENAPQQLLTTVRRSPEMVGQDLVPAVTCAQPYTWTAGSQAPHAEHRTPHPQVVVMDFGVKHNILRQLVEVGCRVTVVPAQTTAEDIMGRAPDGVVLSNGPGDPAAVTYAIATIRRLLGRLPLFGICLGHQLLGLALGGKTFKLKFGHHGANHPVKDLRTGRVAITSQNHGFAVDFETIPDTRTTLTHLNLNDQTVEGFAHAEHRILSVQYHPEASPGPHDANGLFREFASMLDASH